MATEKKSKYDRILDEMMDSIASHLESLPEKERRRRIKAVATYSFDAPRQHPRTSTLRNGTARSLKRSRVR